MESRIIQDGQGLSPGFLASPEAALGRGLPPEHFQTANTEPPAWEKASLSGVNAGS